MKRLNFINNYLEKTKHLADKIDRQKISKIIEVIEKQLINGKTIFIAGNGGSAATAAHMVCDLNKTILGKNPSPKQKRFKTISLSDNSPLLTAISNDWSYEKIFSEPLKNLAKKGDLFLAITASGNSPNIIQAINVAKKLKMKTIAFLGFDGGRVKKMVDNYILVPSNEYGPVEDIHMIISHLITAFFYEKT